MAKIAVAPLVGAWIEIMIIDMDDDIKYVAPLVGAWIEISVKTKEFICSAASLPSWERGLKLHHEIQRSHCIGVAPLVGAWIEIYSTALKLLMNIVAPLVGAWIEI